jgi:hypothetical protein
VLIVLLGLLVFAGTAYFRHESINGSAFRLAEARRDMCYAAQGYSLDNAGAIPASVAEQCGQGFREYRDGENSRYLTAGLQGLVAGLLVIGLLSLFLRRAGRKDERSGP